MDGSRLGRLDGDRDGTVEGAIDAIDGELDGDALFGDVLGIVLGKRLGGIGRLGLRVGDMEGPMQKSVNGAIQRCPAGLSGSW